jgi:threonine/homoserine/homoserine lactone efflux protein
MPVLFTLLGVVSMILGLLATVSLIIQSMNPMFGIIGLVVGAVLTYLACMSMAKVGTQAPQSSH